jgi:hypothetical protein
VRATIVACPPPDAERYRLLKVPRPPRCRVGGYLTCKIRGRLKVGGLLDAKIMWPYANKGRPCLIVTAELARAICRESNAALCYWLGVTGQTVTLWRKALGVATTNEGTRWLRRRWWIDGGIGEAARPGWETAVKTQEFAAKVAMSKRGKGRPRHVIEAMRRGRLGRPHSEATKSKMREAHARRRHQGVER